MTNIDHMVKISLIVVIIRILEAEATLEIIEIDVVEILGIGKGDMPETEAEIEIIEEDLIEIKVGTIQDPGVEED